MPWPRVRRTGAALGLCAVLALAGCAEPEPDLGLQVASSSEGASDPAAGSGAPGQLGGDQEAFPVAPGAAQGDPAKCPVPEQGRTYRASELNAMMQLLRMPQWLAADVGASAPLADGRVAWIFGDTLRPQGYRPLVGDNSMAVSSSTCFSQVTVSGNAPLIDLHRSGQACWPMSIAALPVDGGDRLYVSCSRVQRLPGGLLDFTYLGASLAQLSVKPGKMPVLHSVTTLTPDSHDPTQINWGAALLPDAGYVYLYGSRQPTKATAKAVLVVRALAKDPTNRQFWQYFDGRGWSSDVGRAQEVLSASPGVSQAFSVQRIGAKYVLVSKRGGEFGHTIGVWTAPRPEGPWQHVSDTPYQYDDDSGFVTYQPLAHPELPLSNGKLLVSMSRNPKAFSDLLRDPRRGRPVFVEVPRP
ncbi:DUF4185 domain-containing protein [Luteipulveratus mongoliensis]|uniref:DUF4185 domain-containing protein n=1 Tax=Luteipulveratus mongoliensis TaxID=571913 RepID=A0A0K1JKJ6_9MICO|nr:DUF4185 domain-containing protein [Luteipulveratus mongoliensis]AKU17232.1 hypothetical protein VV02_17515 [Luteipulveratus mongoliensis]